MRQSVKPAAKAAPCCNVGMPSQSDQQLPKLAGEPLDVGFEFAESNLRLLQPWAARAVFKIKRRSAGRCVTELRDGAFERVGGAAHAVGVPGDQRGAQFAEKRRRGFKKQADEFARGGNVAVQLP